jgi:hypothetical protein
MDKVQKHNSFNITEIGQGVNVEKTKYMVTSLYQNGGQNHSSAHPP